MFDHREIRQWSYDLLRSSLWVGSTAAEAWAPCWLLCAPLFHAEGSSEGCMHLCTETGAFVSIVKLGTMATWRVVAYSTTASPWVGSTHLFYRAMSNGSMSVREIPVCSDSGRRQLENCGDQNKKTREMSPEGFEPSLPRPQRGVLTTRLRERVH